MHAKKFVTSNKEETHTPYLLGQTAAKIYLSEKNILGLGALKGHVSNNQLPSMLDRTQCDEFPRSY